MEDSSFLKRLRLVINKLNVTDSEFAAVGGVRKSTFSNYINGNSQPKQESLTLWVQKYGLDANWLLTGEGEMFLGEGTKAQPEEKQEPEQASVTDPIAQRMKVAVDLLKEAGAPPDVIQQAIMKILDSQNEIHTQAEANAVEAPAFADRCEWSMKRT